MESKQGKRKEILQRDGWENGESFFRFIFFECLMIYRCDDTKRLWEKMCNFSSYAMLRLLWKFLGNQITMEYIYMFIVA